MTVAQQTTTYNYNFILKCMAAFVATTVTTATIIYITTSSAPIATSTLATFAYAPAYGAAMASILLPLLLIAGAGLLLINCLTPRTSYHHHPGYEHGPGYGYTLFQQPHTHEHRYRHRTQFDNAAQYHTHPYEHRHSNVGVEHFHSSDHIHGSVGVELYDTPDYNPQSHGHTHGYR